MHCRNSPLKKTVVFRNKMRCGLVDMRHNLRGLLPHLTEAGTVCLRETRVHAHLTTWCYIAGKLTLQTWDWQTLQYGGSFQFMCGFCTDSTKKRFKTYARNSVQYRARVLRKETPLNFRTKSYCFWLVTDVPLWWLSFSPSPVCVGFVVDKVALERVHQVLQSSRISIVIPVLSRLLPVRCGHRGEWRSTVTRRKKFLCFVKFSQISLRQWL